MRTYRYVDKERLRSYLEQINPISESEKRERKSSLKFSLGFLTAGVEEKRPPITELSEHQKIESLISYLKENDQLAIGRAENDAERPDFVLETFEAFDVNVPKTDSDEEPAFRFWFSKGNDNVSALCLLEYFDSVDEHHLSFQGMSTFSVLAAFAYHARDKINQSILERVIPRIPHPNPHAKIDETHPPSHHYEFYSVKDYIWRFVAEPEELFKEWGCKLGQPKSLSALYRIKELGREAAKSWQLVSTFGYPIAVWQDKA